MVACYQIKQVVGGLFMGVCLTTGVFAQQAQPGNGVATTSINNWSYQRHASTATEGYLNGAANVIQSQGQATYLRSLAAVNYEEARRRYIDNSRKYVAAVIENREAIKAYRAKYKKSPPSPELLARVRALNLPDRLTDEQFEASTGRLVWPHVLRGDEYKAIRDRVDMLFAARTPENSGDGSPFQREVDALVSDFNVLLKANVKTLTASQYGHAHEFLRSIDYEALLPLDSVKAPVGDTVAPVNASTPEETKGESKPVVGA